MITYTYGKWLKIIMVFFLLILLFVFTALVFMPFFDPKTSLSVLYIIAPISFTAICLCLLGLRDFIVAKVIITGTYISSRNVLSDRKLWVKEIKGFQKIEHYTLIYPKDKFKKRIKISDYISGSEEIRYWLENRFPDLNSLKEEKEEKDFYRNSEYGISKKDKDILLKKAQKTAKLVRIISISMTVLMLFLWKYFQEETFVYALVFIPLIVMFIVIFFKGIIKYNEKKEGEQTIYPTVLWGFLAPIFGLILYVFLSIDILTYDSIWELLIYTTLIVFFLCVYGSKEYKFENAKTIGAIVSLLFFSAMYSFSAIIIANVFFDNSNPKAYKSSIVEKRISKGKTTSFYFKLDNKDLSKETKEFKVNELLYNTKEIGDAITVFVKDGMLDIPYYKIR